MHGHFNLLERYYLNDRDFGNWDERLKCTLQYKVEI